VPDQRIVTAHLRSRSIALEDSADTFVCTNLWQIAAIGNGWFNNKRLLEPIGNIPPAELEKAYYEQQERQAMAA